MAMELLDACGRKCPQPVLKVAAKSADMKSGDILEVIGDCPTFEKDIRTWCSRTNRAMLSIKDEGKGRLRIQIQF